MVTQLTQIILLSPRSKCRAQQDRSVLLPGSALRLLHGFWREREMLFSKLYAGNNFCNISHEGNRPCP